MKTWSHYWSQLGSTERLNFIWLDLPIIWLMTRVLTYIEESYKTRSADHFEQTFDDKDQTIGRSSLKNTFPSSLVSFLYIEDEGN